MERGLYQKIESIEDLFSDQPEKLDEMMKKVLDETGVKKRKRTFTEEAEGLYVKATWLSKYTPFGKHDEGFNQEVERFETTTGIQTKLRTQPYPERFDIKKAISGVQKNDLGLIKENFYNIFEDVLAEEDSYIEKAKALLQDAGSDHAFLSGSGPSVFCIVKDREEARKIAGRIPAQNDMDVYLAGTFRRA